MNYEVKYKDMQVTSEKVQGAAKSLEGCANRLANVKSALGFSTSLSGYVRIVGERSAAVSIAAKDAAQAGLCLENARAQYLTAEQQSYQSISGDTSFGAGGSAAPVDAAAPAPAPAGPGANSKPWWGSVWDCIGLLPEMVAVGPALSMVLLATIPWKDLITDSSRTVGTSAGLYGPGYSTDIKGWHKGDVTAWLGKASASAENEFAYAEVNAYLGKAKAEWEADFSFFKSKKTKEGDSKTFFNAVLGGGASVAAVAVDAKAGVGTDMLGAEIKGEGTLGVASAEGKIKANVSDKGVSVYAEGELMAAAAKGKVKGTVNVLGFEITAKAEGYAGAAGVKGEFGIKDNKFVMFGGASALLGGGVGIEIGLNDEGWKQAGEFVSDVAEGVGGLIKWIGW